MSYFDELLNFCSKYKKVYCYGAGEYGEKVLQVLKRNGISPEGFLISEGEKKELDGIPVEVFGGFDLVKNSECGVILSLHERYHENIIHKLNQAGIKDIFAVTSEDVNKKISRELSDITLLQDLMSEKADVEFEEDYVERAENILKKYSTIELQYIFLRQMGGVCFWMYYSQQRKQQPSDKYYLYFPIAYHTENNNLRNMPNNFLMTKLKGEGIEVITFETLGFWQFFVKNYKERMHINNGHSLLSMSDEFNQAVSEGKLDVNQVFIQFNESEINRGKELLKMLGVSDYICIANRDSAYRRDIMEFTYGPLDVIDMYRNSDIDNFDLTADYLDKLNISAVRMGAVAEKRVKSDSKIIDYVFKMRSDFADVYLFSQCRFFISDSSGIQVIPKLFAKPVISINNAVFTTKVDIILPSNENYDLMILQKYWDTGRGRYLTIRELIEMEINGEEEKLDDCRPANTLMLYHKKGILPVKNTPEEILDVVKEMLLRLNGEMEYDDLDLQLKNKYDLIKSEFIKKGQYFFNMRIGRDFLRQNQWLLD